MARRTYRWALPLREDEEKMPFHVLSQIMCHTAKSYIVFNPPLVFAYVVIIFANFKHNFIRSISALFKLYGF